MMPRLPVNNPRCGVAMMSPVGVTRFCSGIRTPEYAPPRHCEERQRRRNPAFRLSVLMDCFAALAMTSNSRRAIADRRLKRERGIPGKEDPGVLRHFGDESVDQRPSHRFCIHRGAMRIHDHVAHQPPGLAAVAKLVDDQQSLASAAAEFRGVSRNALENLQVALLGWIV